MSKVECTHCGLEFDKDVMIEDSENYFCCNGCQGVYHLLSDSGLDSFYSKKGDTKLTPKDSLNYENSTRFDLESFKEKYIKIDKDGFASIALIIEGIHCSACVWLNEKVLHQEDGIVQASINFTTHKAKIVYDQDIISLSQIIEIIRAIGYNAYPYDPSTKEKTTNLQRKDYYVRLIVAVFGAMNIMTIAFAKYSGYFSGMSLEIQKLLQLVEFVVATPVLFYSGWMYFRGAYFGLKNRFVNMDFLVASGASLTYFYSIYAMFNPPSHTYFDSVVMIVTFVSIGKFMEVLSKKAIIDKLDMVNSDLPDDVMVIVDNNKIQTPSIDVKVDDIIEIKAGEKIVIDGILISGEGSFDESSISGEATPYYKKVDDTIISGSILLDSTLRYRATATYEDSTIYKLAQLTNEAMDKKPKIENLTNEISGWFSLVILGVSLMAFAGWYYSSGDLENSMIIGISVIVIACPCALALATPIATLVGIGSATKNNLIFKEAKHLETMSNAKYMVFDKTGTLTHGKPKILSFDIKQQFDISLVYTLTSHSSHPISKSIYQYIADNYSNIKELDASKISLIEAKGISATIDTHSVVGGSRSYLSQLGIDVEDIKIDDSMFLVAVDGVLALDVRLEDTLKDGAKELINNLQKMGIKTYMLTGDNESVASKVAQSLGIDEYHSFLSPFDKADFIMRLKSEGVVVMAGDGINDALALSNSNIAIAMGSGAKIAIEASDVIVLDNSLKSLQNGFEISKTTFYNIKQNLLISLVYNLVTIPLAVMGYIIPMIAALSMSLSSLLVVANSFRIKYKNR